MTASAQSGSQAAHLAPSPGELGARSSYAWSATLALIAAVFVVRLAYMIWLSPYELIGDEAYFWEQARHLDWGYNEKGPALAWSIALSCWMFGTSEWAVRLPVIVASAVAAWGLGRLTLSATRQDGRAAFLAVACFCLIPGMQGNAQIITHDGLLIPIWVALAAVGLRFFRRWRSGAGTAGSSLLLWVVLGLGFLVKQSILLFLPGLAVFWLIQRRKLPWRWSLVTEHLVGAIIFLFIISPMVYWNYRHGWPTLAHTLGHLGAGGDQAGHSDSGNPIIWVSMAVGGVLFSFGPAIILFVWASLWALRNRRADDEHWADQLWIMCSAWPSLAFYLLLSLTKPIVPSWPIPSLAPLVVLAGEQAVRGLAQYRELIRNWRAARVAAAESAAPRPRRPDTPFHQTWVALILYGGIGWLVLSFPTPLARLPFVGARIQRSALNRISGHRAQALALQAELDQLRHQRNIQPLIVARHYMQASLYAFYLPDHPVVATAGTYLGKRSKTFDHWDDTDLANPALHGRWLLLDGRSDVPWNKALKFDSIEPLAGGRYYLARNYRGPQPDHPEF